MHNKPKTSGEAARLEMVRRVFTIGERPKASSVVLGVEGMDDAALLQIPIGRVIVMASDFVRGSGFYLFQLGYLTYFDVGYYLIVANMSDLAAMGAEPLSVTTIIRYSTEMTDEQFVEALHGIRTAADAYGVEVVGGDIGGYEADVFAATALGVVAPNRALRRCGAKRGDVLCVTGIVGRPITALTYFKKAKDQGLALDPAAESSLLESWRRPVARVRAGEVLSSLGWVSACQDISDGLRATVDQIGHASGVSFRLWGSSIPIDALTSRVADFLETDPISLAMSASVDFELLFTIPRNRVDETETALSSAGCAMTVIGEAKSTGPNQLVVASGESIVLPGVAWDHQTDDYLASIVMRGRLP